MVASIQQQNSKKEVEFDPKDTGTERRSECVNQMLVEKVRSMLADSRLPHQFWAEALLASFPVLLFSAQEGARATRGEKKESLVSTACACAKLPWNFRASVHEQ